ncbi:hypothetical protein IGI04_034121, partial [Brassica rapa subsp. trilocularis]
KRTCADGHGDDRVDSKSVSNNLLARFKSSMSDLKDEDRRLRTAGETPTPNHPTPKSIGELRNGNETVDLLKEYPSSQDLRRIDDWNWNGYGLALFTEKQNRRRRRSEARTTEMEASGWRRFAREAYGGGKTVDEESGNGGCVKIEVVWKGKKHDLFGG